ncbi:LuxR C-terminal-related transcriptional regulator [Povalibacter sp.]|uniref:LuxR C-terminal-related transcriptional regulator n=1 Tax=Povalibacter sp. TaxID=1962978 RepID=UPI002F42A052
MRTAINRLWRRLRVLDLGRVCEEIDGLDKDIEALGAIAADEFRSELIMLRAIALGLLDDDGSLLALVRSPAFSSGAGCDGALAVSLYRLAQWKCGELQNFHAQRRIGAAAQQGDVRVLAFDLALDAAVELQQLRLGVARRLAQQSDELESSVRRKSPALLFGGVLLAQLLYEQGELAEAERWLRDHLPSIRNRACAEVAIRCYVLLARIAVDRNNGDLAIVLLRDGIALGDSRGWDRLAAVCEQEWIGILLRAGNLEEASKRAARMQSRWPGADPGDNGVGAAVMLARCRTLLAGGFVAEAVVGLRWLIELADARGDAYSSVQLQIRVAEALGSDVDQSAAIEALLAALEIGASAGLYQSFVSAGPAIMHLIARAQDRLARDANGRHFLHPYVCSLLGRRTVRPVTRARQIRLFGPLSSREHTILALMRHGSSNKLIAKQLGIAPETVKSHAKRIFIKLGAQTRVEAVVKAASLSLI